MKKIIIGVLLVLTLTACSGSSKKTLTCSEDDFAMDFHTGGSGDQVETIEMYYLTSLEDFGMTAEEFEESKDVLNSYYSSYVSDGVKAEIILENDIVKEVFTLNIAKMTDDELYEFSLDDMDFDINAIYEELKDISGVSCTLK